MYDWPAAALQNELFQLERGADGFKAPPMTTGLAFLEARRGPTRKKIK